MAISVEKFCAPAGRPTHLPTATMQALTELRLGVSEEKEATQKTKVGPVFDWIIRYLTAKNAEIRTIC